ncbi:MAG TPA: hypothetical protein PLA50_18675 [Bacteroidia bacterium]|nr:hypothetical protein [Bacteroidia bacterium]
MKGAFLSAVGGLFSVLLLGTASLQGHQDPVGDVHPAVMVENGRFSVYFRNNERAAEFRKVYRSSGKLAIPRHRVKETPDSGRRARRTEGGRSFSLDEECRNLIIRSGDEVSGKIALPWPGGKMPTRCRDYVVVGGWLVMLGTLPHPDSPDQRTLLTLSFFDWQHPGPPKTLHLGEVATIYFSPTSSPLAPVGDRLALAWMGQPEGQEDRQFCLTTVDASGQRLATRKLADAYQWNTTISVAAIGSRLCIAWHDGEIYGPFRKAKIRTIFEDLPVE